LQHEFQQKCLGRIFALMRYEPLTTLALINSPITTSASGRSRFNQRSHSATNGTIRYLMEHII
jgi:hypothetical protein